MRRRDVFDFLAIGVMCGLVIAGFLVVIDWQHDGPEADCRLKFDDIAEYSVLSDVCRSASVREAMKTETALHEMALIDDGKLIGG